MSKIRGVDVFVSVGGTDVGSQTNASFKGSTKEIDASDKSTGGFDVTVAGNRKWSIDCDALLLDSDPAQEAIFNAWENGTAVTVAVDFGQQILTGSAYVTSYELSGEKDGMATCKATFSGASALS